MDQYNLYNYLQPDQDVPLPTKPLVKTNRTKAKPLQPALKKIPKYNQQLCYPDVDLSPPCNMETFYKMDIDPNEPPSSEDDVELWFSKTKVKAATKYLPPCTLKKLHPPDQKYKDYVEVPETDNIDYASIEVCYNSTGTRVIVQFCEGYFPGTVVDTFFDEVNGDRIQFWQVKFNNGDQKDLDFDKFKRAIAYNKIYPNSMMNRDNSLNPKDDSTYLVDNNGNLTTAVPAPTDSLF